MATTTADPVQSDAVRRELEALAWAEPLREFQIDGVERLLRDDQVLLADEMGLGKTIQAIAALRVLNRRGALADPALIVAPSSIVQQWQRQLRRWAPELGLRTAVGPADLRVGQWRADAKVFLVSYDGLRFDAALKGPWAPLSRRWSVVVADEAQRLKNPRTEAAILVKRLWRERAWALTGTPLENKVEDLISVLEFVAPGRFRAEEMMYGLRGVMGDVQLRRRRAQMLPDLPPKTTEIVGVVMGAAQRAAYLDAEREGRMWLRSLGRDLTITHVLELILRLKQICNFCPRTGESAKLEDMRGRLEQLIGGGEKAIVFSQFAREPFGLDAMAQALSAYRPLLLAGGLDAASRAGQIDRFERDPDRRLMLISLRAGGVGLNLTCASAVFHFDRWWNPAVERQAEDRAHRMGQTRPVQVFTYQTPGTIEERIGAILAEKAAIFDRVVDGIDTPQLARLDLDSLLAAIGEAGSGPAGTWRTAYTPPRAPPARSRTSSPAPTGAATG